MPAWCYAHNQFCPTSRTHLPSTCESVSTMPAAGLVCTDVTRTGRQEGDAGNAMRSHSSWLWERHHEQDVVVHVECGPDWDPRRLFQALGETHQILSVQLCGTVVSSLHRPTLPQCHAMIASLCLVGCESHVVEVCNDTPWLGCAASWCGLAMCVRVHYTRPPRYSHYVVAWGVCATSLRVEA